MADIVDFQRRSGERPDPEPPRKPAKRRAHKRAADKRRPEQRQAERRQADRRRTARRRIDRMLPLLMALVGLATGAFGALVVRTQDVSSPPFGGRFALCGNGVWQQCVVDGDTIRFAGATIRLADINAPETRGAQCPSERALGNRATRRLRALLNQGRFTLVRAGSRDLDRYGRKLRVIRRDGRSLGEVLVAEGLARRWTGQQQSWCR